MSVDTATDAFEVVAAQLRQAKSVVEIFGKFSGIAADDMKMVRTVYRMLAKIVHPDHNVGRADAAATFDLLQRSYETAQRVANGEKEAAIIAAAAPPAAAPVVMKTRQNEYTVGPEFATGDITVVYQAGVVSVKDGVKGDVVLKIARDPRDNDLLENEAKTLRHLASDDKGKKKPPYIPRIGESFLFRDATGLSRRVNSFPIVVTEQGPIPARAFFTLEEIRATYPSGVDPRQMAWMWRRLILALAYTHEQTVVHGAVLPSHILIQPEAHGLVLVDWTHSVREPRKYGGYIPYVSTAYEAWYPPEVLARKEPTGRIDQQMAAMSMIYLLGGDPLTDTIPATVPPNIAGHLRKIIKSSRSGSMHSLSSGTRGLFAEFDSIITAEWGPRKFVPFTMPTRS